MKVFPPRRHHHHQHLDKEAHHWNKKIAKKMAKLEQKLCKYSAASGETANDWTSSRDSSRCRSRSKSRGCRSRSRSRGAERRRMCRRYRRHGKRFASHGGSSSSSNDSSSDCESSGASSSSRSPSPLVSPPQPGHHHRGPLQGRHHRRPHHQTHHHRGRWSCHHHCNDGIQACLYRILSQSEPNLQAPQASEDQEDRVSESNNARVGFDTNSVDDEQPNADNPMDDDIQEVNNKSSDASSIDATLADQWKKTIVEGLPTDTKTSLLKKYSVSENRHILKAPKINPEMLSVATEAAIKNDCILLCEQNQIGSGLAALSQAITNLNSHEELRQDKCITETLEKLNNAADIFLNAHHELSTARKLIMIPELRKGARNSAENCKTDDLLFGRDFAEKVKNEKWYKKNKKNNKGHRAEGKCETGKKRKHNHHDGERRTSKRLDLSGLSIKSS